MLASFRESFLIANASFRSHAALYTRGAGKFSRPGDGEDAGADLENFEELMTMADGAQARSLLERKRRKDCENLKLKILQRKYFKKPQEMNFLTWGAKEQIRFLHHEFGHEWSVARLAQSFPVSEEGVVCILKSKYVPASEEAIKKHDIQVRKRWLALKETSGKEGGPVSIKQHLDKGKLHLMINAAGIQSLPKPEQAVLTTHTDRQIGHFEAIIKDYVDRKRESKQRKNSNEDLDNQKCLKEFIVSHGGKELLEEKGDATNCGLKASVKSEHDNGMSSDYTKLPRRLRKHLSTQQMSISGLSYLQAYQMIGTQKLPGSTDSFHIKSRFAAEPIGTDCQLHVAENGSNVTFLSEKPQIPKYRNIHFNFAQLQNGEEQKPSYLKGPRSKSVEKIKIPKRLKREGRLYCKENVYYDEDGEFLYRIPVTE